MWPLIPRSLCQKSPASGSCIASRSAATSVPTPSASHPLTQGAAPVQQVKDGIKPLEAEKPAPAPKAAPGPESAPHSGIGLTRADYERERRKAERLAAEEAEAAKAKSSTPIDVVHEDEDDAPSAFRKKEPA